MDGVQGSGKSWLCARLGVKCVDTDDLPDAARKLRCTVPQLVRKLIRDHNPIVFAGMTAAVPRATHRFFIKITDHPTTYRRLMLRELDKVVDRAPEIRRQFRTADVKRLNILHIARNSVPLSASYADYLRDYRERAAKARRKGYTVLEQQDILQEIRALCRE